MRILIFSPHAMSDVTGNTVTLRRLQRNLTAAGHKVQIATPASDDRPDLVREAITVFSPDVVHWYHAYKTGKYLPVVKPEAPSVVTVSGTDLNEDCADAERKEVVRTVLEAARIVVGASDSMAARFKELFPEEVSRFRQIAKGVEVGDKEFDLGLARTEVMVFLPGGIRPVKNNLFALSAIDPVAAEIPELRLVMAGHAGESAYTTQVNGEIARRTWSRHIGVIPHESMGHVYGRASVVLNTSRSEGLSNTVMEAMSCGATVLASDIPGNRSVIRDGVTGHLYKDEGDFRERLADLMRNPGTTGRAAREWAAEHFSPERETEDMLKAYGDALSAEA